MSLRHINRVLYHLPLRVTDGQFRLLVYLADKANGDGEDIYPSVERLVRWSGLGARFVQHTLQEFHLAGWLRAYSRAGALRWRLDLPVENPAENPTQPVENAAEPDRGSVARDRKDIFFASSIRGSNTRSLLSVSDLGEGRLGPPSFDPSFDPSHPPKEQAGAHSAPASSSHTRSDKDGPVALQDIRATLANLKARLDATRVDTRRSRR